MTADDTAKPLTADLTAKVAERAYQLWESEGQPHGRAIDHWLKAEAELAVFPPQAATIDRKPSTPRGMRSKSRQG